MFIFLNIYYFISISNIQQKKYLLFNKIHTFMKPLLNMFILSNNYNKYKLN